MEKISQKKFSIRIRYSFGKLSDKIPFVTNHILRKVDGLIEF